MSASFTIDRKTAAELLQVSVRTIDRYLKKGKLRFEKRDRSIYILKEDLIAEMRKRNLRIPLFIDPKIKDIAEGADYRVNQIVEAPSISEEESYKVKNVDNVQARQTEAEALVTPSEPVNVAQNTSYEGNILTGSTRLEDRVADSLDFYKNLYEVTKADLDDKVQQLNKLTFRLGQLETQVKSSIPLLEYKKQEKLLNETTSRYQEALNKARIDAKHSEGLLLRQIDEKERELIDYANKIKDIKHQLYLEEKNKHVFTILTFLALSALPIVWLALK